MDDVLLKTRFSKDSRMDVASHFILRAAYCRTEEFVGGFSSRKRRCFVMALRAFLRAASRNKMDLDQVSSGEKERLRDKLMSVGGITPTDFSMTPYMRIPFTQALDLIATRACHVQGGLA